MKATGTSNAHVGSRPSKFAHILYRTRRFKEMLEWYRTVFDARIMYQNEALAFLTYDDEHHRFAFGDMSVLNPDGAENIGHGSVDHVAYTYDSVRDLLENYARLKEQRIAPYWCIHHGIAVSLYYADPDGNQLEFQVDSFATPEEAQDFMNEHWDQNPIGVEFDADAWLIELRDGKPESEFLERHIHEPVSPLRGSIAPLLQ